MEVNLLTPYQKRILEAASRTKNLTDRFFLTGGTALSYFYFKHRFSEDLDFFSEEEYNQPLLLKTVTSIGSQVKALKVEQQTLTGQEIFYFRFGDGSLIKVDFAYFPFHHMGPYVKFNDLKVSSVEDIAVNKLQAILSRKRSRDYLDLYYCLENLDWDAKGLQKNYQLKFDVHLSCEQLATSFANVLDSSDLPRFLGNTNWLGVESYFLKLSESLGNEILG